MSSEVGRGHISIFPVMTGFKSKVSREMKTTGETGAKGFKKAFASSGAGAAIGRLLGRESKKAFSVETAGLANSAGFKKLKSEYVDSVRALSKARLKQQDEAGRVRVAEARLNEVLAKGPANSARAIAASERLAAARRREALAVEAVNEASKRMKDAKSVVEALTNTSEASAGLVARLHQVKKSFAEGKKEGQDATVETTSLARVIGRLTTTSIIPAVDSMKSFVTQMRGSAKNAIISSTAFGKLSNVVTPIRSQFLSLGASVANVSSTAFGKLSNVLTPIRSKFLSLAASAAIGARGLGVEFMNKLGPFAPFVRDLGSKMASGMTSGMGLLREAASAGMRGVVGAVTSMAGKMRDTIAQAGKAAAGLVKGALVAASAAIAANVGGAISRVDTLNNFPKVMVNLGYTSDEASASLKRLDEGIHGLPTALDDIASTTQRLAPLTNGLGNATELSLALNNALLAGGKGGAEASRAMTQYTQMLGKGSVDLMSWRTLQEVMPGQLNQIAKALLGPTANSQALYDAMQSGAVSFDDFNNAILKLNSEGLEGYASFAEQAKDATGGIGTAITNVGTAIKRNIAKVIQAIGADKIRTVFESISSIIDSVGSKISGVISSFSSGDLGGFTGNLSALAPVIGGVLGAIGPLLAKLPYLSGVFGGLSGPVGLLVGAFTGLISASPGLQAALGGLLDGALGSLGEVVSSLAPVFSELMTTVGEFLGVIGDSIGQALVALTPILEQLISGIGGFIGELLPLLIPLITQIGQVIADSMPVLMQIVQAIMPPIMALAQALAPVLLQIVGVIVQLVQGALQLITPLLQLIGVILPPLVALFTAVLTPVIALASAIIGSLMPVITGLMTVFQGLINFVVGVFTGNWSMAWTGVKQMFFGFVDGVRGLIKGALRLAFEGIPNMIIGIFSNAGSWLLDAGSRIISGLIDGLASAIGGVKDFLTGLTSSIADWKGPKEVDDVLLVDAGRRIMGGFRRSLEAEQEPIKRQLNKFTREIGKTNAQPATFGNTNNELAPRQYPQTMILKVGEREFKAFLEEEQVRALNGI